MGGLVRVVNDRGVIAHVDQATLETLGAEWGNTRETPAPTPAEAPEGDLPAGNASRDVWAKFALTLGLEVGDDMKRDEIRAAVEQLVGE